MDTPTHNIFAHQTLSKPKIIRGPGPRLEYDNLLASKASPVTVMENFGYRFGYKPCMYHAM